VEASLPGQVALVRVCVAGRGLDVRIAILIIRSSVSTSPAGRCLSPSFGFARDVSGVRRPGAACVTGRARVVLRPR